MAVLFTLDPSTRIPNSAALLSGFDDTDTAEGPRELDMRWWFAVNVRGGGGHNRGGEVHLDVADTLFVGGLVRTDVASTPRIVFIECGGTRVIQLSMRTAASGADNHVGHSVAVWNGADNEASYDTNNRLIDTGNLGDSTVNANLDMSWQLRLTRGETEGTVTLWWQGEQYGPVDAPSLADAAGNITKVVFTGRSATTSSGDQYLYHRDLWVDDASNWSDAQVRALTPKAQGFHDDGVGSEVGDKFALVNNIPPDTDTFVGLPAGGKESYLHDVPAHDKMAVAAINVRSVMSAESDVHVFVRQDSADEQAMTLSPQGEDPRVYSGIAHLNPHTGMAFTLADLADIDLGYEASSG